MFRPKLPAMPQPTGTVTPPAVVEPTTKNGPAHASTPTPSAPASASRRTWPTRSPPNSPDPNGDRLTCPPVTSSTP